MKTIKQMKTTKPSRKQQSYSSPALPGHPLSTGDIVDLVREGEEGEGISMDVFKKKWQHRLARIK